MNRARYSVHPGVAMAQQWVAAFPEKTGRSIEAWAALVREKGPASSKDRVEWLKQRHGLGTNYAKFVADWAEGGGRAECDPDVYLAQAADYVEAMYRGPKAALRPIHDRLIALGRGLGPDVRICPCQTIVPLYRHHVFAQVKPTTQTRIDLGLALGDTKRVPRRLIDTGGFEKKDRITHRIAITSLGQIDDEVTRWLRTAYERDQPRSQKPR